MNSIEIEPVSIWTPTGVQVATSFETRYINYNGSTAVADCHLWTAGTEEVPAVEVQATLVTATEEQCASWGTDNLPFYRELAVNAGLTPVE